MVRALSPILEAVGGHHGFLALGPPVFVDRAVSHSPVPSIHLLSRTLYSLALLCLAFTCFACCFGSQSIYSPTCPTHTLSFHTLFKLPPRESHLLLVPRLADYSLASCLLPLRYWILPKHLPV